MRKWFQFAKPLRKWLQFAKPLQGCNGAVGREGGGAEEGRGGSGVWCRVAHVARVDAEIDVVLFDRRVLQIEHSRGSFLRALSMSTRLL